ncbi:MAG: hypothetical protein QGI45_04600 [Myxococcota bacterium]|jgi:hypothetical protein|nr:hypothetical protein [Myxococcota bacterium]
MHVLLKSGLLCMVFGLACTSHTSPKSKPVPVERLISSGGVGLLTLAQVIPESAYVEKPKGFNYDHYWDLGYFTTDGMRLLHLEQHDVIVLTTPKHNVQHILVGPAYKTAEGLGLKSKWSTLKNTFSDMRLAEESLSKYWLYRPDRVTFKNGDMRSMGFEDQKDRKELGCAAAAESLPNIKFYFETCAMAKSGSPAEAVLVSNPDDTDLRFEDPFVNLHSVPPCPKSRTEDVEALTQRGLNVLRTNKMGDYHATKSVKKGLPLLRDAALSGSKEAAGTYAAVVFTYVLQEVIGDPLQRPMDQGAQEVAFFMLLNLLRSQETNLGECLDVVLDFSQSLPGNLFEESEEEDSAGVCAGAFYQFSYFKVAELEAIRQQARAWATCWDKAK